MKRAIIALMVLVLIIVCFGGCEKSAEESYVVKIGSENVFSPEFRFYFYLSQLAYEEEGGKDIWLTTINGLKAEDVAKDRTFESIIRIKISCMHADALGIALTEEDKQTASDMADSYRAIVDNKVFEEIEVTQEMLQKIMEETLTYGKVFDEVTKNVQISEKDFTIYYENYIKNPQNQVAIDDDLIDLSDILRRQYTQKTKNDVFAEQYSKWEANVEIQKNQDVWDTIHIIASAAT